MNDVLRLLALELDLPDLINMCSTNSQFKKEICDNNFFWMNKLKKEYPRTRGKVFPQADYRKIYLSLKNKIKKEYNIYISTENSDFENVPKFFNYVTVEPLSDADYEIAAERFLDFTDRSGEESGFDVIGDFPSGTQMYLAFSDDKVIGFSEAFLTKEEAINYILKNIEALIEEDYTWNRADEEDLFPHMNRTETSMEQYYGGDMEQVLDKARRDLNSKRVFIQPSHSHHYDTYYFHIHYTITQINL